jgi:hypothetical protein
MMRKARARALILLALAMLSASALAAGASAAPLPGAIFTTLPDGSEVNFNIYDSKDDVYLDGGPGPGAPQEAAGLPDGTYLFQVTDPSGKTLLSTDPAQCRLFTVQDGVISGVVDSSCEHLTGTDVDHGATTVQLMPYLDTPNNGGVYKVWVTPLADYECALNLALVDCGGQFHGFVPSSSKTDNFKVRTTPVVEIDTIFHNHATGQVMTGPGIKWTDTLGASNAKWSYYAPQLNVVNEAHVEAIEAGVHKITVANQAGCTVANVLYNKKTTQGPTTVSVDVKTLSKAQTIYIHVACL